MNSSEKPTTILREEHTEVLKNLDSLEGIIHRLDKKNEVSGELAALARFFSTELELHLKKEERALFPELEEFIPRDSGPIGVMLVEHDDLRNTSTKIQHAIETYLDENSDNPTIRRTLQGHSTYFTSLLRGHIDKENNILFMMADMHLDKTQVAKIAKLFHEIDPKN